MRTKNTADRSVLLFAARVLTFVCVSTPLVLSYSAAQAKHMSKAQIEQKVDSLLRLMTLEEKLGQLNQSPAEWNSETKRQTTPAMDSLARKGLIGSFLNVVGSAETRRVQRIAAEGSRLRIPLLFGFDAIHGYRTTFPIPLGEASTWDTSLVRRAARVSAVEASAAGINWTFAPMVDIARDPRWGRIAEGSGEDPYLGSLMAAARVRGFQGDDLASPTSLLACAKHYVAYGGAEAGRDYNAVEVSERTLREVYLPPFKAALDAGAGTLMSSFNDISGIPASANRHTLTDILRHEWGFQGFVVSDWAAIEQLQAHGVAANREEAGRLALTAGVDMDMATAIYLKDLPKAVREKRLSEDLVNEAVRRVLRVKFSMGLFDNPYRGSSAETEEKVTLTKESLALAREVAQKSIVLLKNETTILPLKKDLKRIALLGPLADSHVEPLGTWRGRGDSADVVSVLEGVRQKVSSQTSVTYAKGCGIGDDSKAGFDEAVRLARQADVVILVVGEAESMSGEAASRSLIGLPGVQEDLVRAIHAAGKPLVLVLMNGRPLAIPWEAAHVPAIVETWFLGSQCGNAIADVLFGDVNPSGKLPVTFPRSLGQIPIYYNHKSTGRPFVDSDRYTSKYIDVPNTPLYPFGHGLSYTRFTFSDLRLNRASIGTDDTLNIAITVKNSGERPGDEVVQLYVHDEVASVTRPVKELKGFRRVTLAAGEGRSIEFCLSPQELALYNQEMKRVIEPGFFKVFVGGNSAECLETRFELKNHGR